MITETLDNYSVASSAALDTVDAMTDVRFPKPNELFIDIDNEEDYVVYLAQLDRLRQFYYVEVLSDTLSKSGYPKRHIVLGLEFDVNSTERLLLQAAMGSDRVRELLGFIRVQNDDPYPTLFLEKREQIQLPASSLEAVAGVALSEDALINPQY